MAPYETKGLTEECIEILAAGRSLNADELLAYEHGREASGRPCSDRLDPAHLQYLLLFIRAYILRPAGCQNGRSCNVIMG